MGLPPGQAGTPPQRCLALYPHSRRGAPALLCRRRALPLYRRRVVRDAVRLRAVRTDRASGLRCRGRGRCHDGHRQQLHRHAGLRLMQPDRSRAVIRHCHAPAPGGWNRIEGDHGRSDFAPGCYLTITGMLVPLMPNRRAMRELCTKMIHTYFKLLIDASGC